MSKECDTFECSICFSDCPYRLKKKNNEVQCPQCMQQVCVTCQTMFAKGECMHCKMVWKVSFLMDTIGSSFYEKIIKPAKIAEMIRTEKENLPKLQGLVEWEKKTREEKDKARFGIAPTIIPRPKAQTIQIQVFPCPVQTCRGFISSKPETDSKYQGSCGVCSVKVCMKCHKTFTEGHTCLIEDIQSLLAIQQDSKQCPRCTSFIFRTEGCNHMYCTNCHTHFDWVSGSVLKSSTNGHYLNLKKFSEHVATLPIVEEGAKEKEKECVAAFSLTKDKIDLEKMKEKGYGSERFLHSLYEDSNTIRLLKRRRYVEEEMTVEYRMKIEEYDIKYLMNELTEVQWGRMLFQQFKQYERSLLYAEILTMYLSTIDMLQEQLFTQGEKDMAMMEVQLRELLQLCNQSFESIQKEYGGSVMHIREYDDPLEMPSIC